MLRVVCALLFLPRAAMQTQLREIHGGGMHALVHAPRERAAVMPLLLYLHGAGESGSNVRELISEGATGTPPVELEHGTAPPALASSFVMVAPQTARGWSRGVVSEFLDYLLSDASGLALDPRRCYVTGHSMGGGGALAAGATRRFAAVAPVAPAGHVPPAALKGVPVWAFHGRNDVVVPSRTSEALIKGLRGLGAPEAESRLTLYDDAPAPVGWPSYFGHASTIPAYATEELYSWMLERALGA